MARKKNLKEEVKGRGEEEEEEKKICPLTSYFPMTLIFKEAWGMGVFCFVVLSQLSSVEFMTIEQYSLHNGYSVELEIPIKV